MNPTKFSEKTFYSRWRHCSVSRHQSEKSKMAELEKKESILQRNVLELPVRNSKEVSCTCELLGHGLKYTLTLVWKENLR